MLQEAINTYHDLLTDDLACESQEQLDDQHKRRGLLFGERPLCTVLRPRFLTAEQHRFIQRRSRSVLRAFHKAYDAAMEDDSLRAQFGLEPWEEQLIGYDPGFHDPSPSGRLDAFFTPETSKLHFIEFNAETPAAVAYGDALSDVFYGLPVMREFLRHYDVRPLPARHSVMHSLLDVFRQWSGRRREAPHIAIMDWREVPTYSEFLLFEEYFRSQGIECEIVDPREVEYRDGRLYAGDFHINLIYKRMLASELIAREGMNSPVVRAVKEGTVCMSNPFRCKLLYKKASLAVLSDERNAHLFTPEERQAIAEHIPWTRNVEERHTLYNGERVELIPFVIEHRERFVLKCNDEYGGKGIVLGWERDAAGWEEAVLGAMTEPNVVQERVSLPSEPYPSLIDDRAELIDRMQDTDPFTFGGDYINGCLTRLSTQSLLNVTSGAGSTVPTFVVEER
ncbi:MAG: hypothetical protein M3Q29_17870 [Chloroflexota bacterium]|nr:hypothetical protein [Chloroflexota bacterium]